MSFRMCDFVATTATETKAAKAHNGNRATSKRRSRHFETLSPQASNAPRRMPSRGACCSHHWAPADGGGAAEARVASSAQL
jgi:hypothetical protein